MPHLVTVDSIFDSDEPTGDKVTGQVNFDSHTSGVVAETVRAVNILTPGHSQGREYMATNPREFDPTVSNDDLTELSAYALELRAVFESVDTGDVDDACVRVNALLC